jgi:hypothetical protein
MEAMTRRLTGYSVVAANASVMCGFLREAAY